MTITADSFTKIDLHDDLARCYRCLRQNLAHKNQLDCRIRCHTRALLEKHIADVSSLCTYFMFLLVKKLHSMIIDQLTDSMLGEHEP